MAAITSIPSAGDKIIEEHNKASDHSWRDMIEQMDKQQQAQNQQQQGKSQHKQSASSASKETSQES